MNTSALPGATLPIARSIASRSALDRRSGAGSTTTATVPPPNSGAVATRIPIEATSVSTPFARQRSGGVPDSASRRLASASTAASIV